MTLWVEVMAACVRALGVLLAILTGLFVIGISSQLGNPWRILVTVSGAFVIYYAGYLKGKTRPTP